MAAEKKAARARNWLLTLNQKGDESLPDGEEWCKHLFEQTGAVYVVGQLEAGNDTERAHIHAYANWPFKMGFTRLKRLYPSINLREVKIDNGVREYCMKEETRVAGPWEFGKIPLLRNSKTDWALVKQAAIAGDFNSIPDSIYVRNYSTLQRIYKDNCKVVDSPHLRGIYIYGESEIGKSSLARNLFPGEPVYTKLHNKWFDGYQNESIIIWDDLGLEHPQYFASYLKLWTDRYGVRGETKGGVVPLNHKYFIITSQYSLEKMFSDTETYAAMSRRCFVYEMAHYKELGMRTIFEIPEMHKFLSGSTKPDTELFIKRT